MANMHSTPRVIPVSTDIPSNLWSGPSLRFSIKTSFLGVVFLLLVAGLGLAERRPPNVLIFITDDESWQERSAYGWSTFPTPHFDRVAREGVLFTRAYASAPSCAPSRAAILTGRNFWELEQGAFIQAWLPAKFLTLPELLAAAGYHTGYTGKGWAPGLLRDPSLPEESGRTLNPAGSAYNERKLNEIDREEGLSDIDYAANFKDFLKARPQGKPFFFWLGSVEPHTPCAPDNWQKLAEKLGVTLDDIKVPGFLPDSPGVRRSRANMLYELARTDENLGQILGILEKAGELENTMLVVTSDNGTQVLRSKANLYDWGVHIPLAIMWPARVPAHRKVDDFVNLIDLAPTVLNAANLPIPREMSGQSLLPILESKDSGRVDPSRNWVATGLEWHGEVDPVNLAGRMIRDERYLYIVNYGDGPRRQAPAQPPLPDSEYEKTLQTGSEVDLVAKHLTHPAMKNFVAMVQSPRPHEELYDTKKDPWQLTNLAESPEYSETKARLKKQLTEYQLKTGDPRATNQMDIFEKTRDLVKTRKKVNYQDSPLQVEE